MQMKYIILLLVTLEIINGQKISKVQNVKVTNKLESESTAVIITWEAPAELQGDKENELRYFVKYCEINTPKCANTTLSNEKRVQLTGLKVKFFYNYHIFTVSKGDKIGEEYKNIFKTAERDTCATDQYACVSSPQCVPSVRKCDGIFNCQDASDEDKHAGCALPTSTPTSIKVFDIKDSSFIISFKQVHQSNRATSYKIELVDTKTQNNSKIYKVNHQKLDATPRTQTISGLKANETYKVRVQAVNMVGGGPWSLYTDLTTSVGYVEDVKDVRVNPIKLFESTAVIIEWDAPNSNAESLMYEVTYCKLNFLDTCKKLPLIKERKITLNTLVKNTFYQYKISVYDSFNNTGSEPFQKFFKTARKNSCSNGFFRCSHSDQCIFQNRTCNGLPDCGDGSDERLDAGCKPPRFRPRNIQVTDKTSNSISLSWDPVPLSDRPQLYIVKVLGENKQTKSVRTGFATRIVKAKVEGLLPNRQYDIHISAVNVVGAGVASKVVKVTTDRTAGGTLDLPQVATSTPVKFKESTNVIIKWSPPTELNGNSPGLIRYRVVYCSINIICDQATEKTKLTHIELKNLRPGHIYQYTVEVFSANNEMGPNSNYTHIFKTQRTNTCEDSYFACTRISQCVKKDRTCNGISDCRDGTDEQTPAGCATPTSVVTLETTKVTENSIIIKFKPVRDLSQRIHSYKIQNIVTNELKIVRHTGFSLVQTINVEFNSLKAGTKYSFRIRAVNPSGDGNWSNIMHQVTKGVKVTPPLTKSYTTKAGSTLPPVTGQTTQGGGEGSEVVSDKSDGMSTAQKAGVAVGVILAVIVIIVSVIALLRMKKSSKKEGVMGVENSAYEMEKNS